MCGMYIGFVGMYGMIRNANEAVLGLDNFGTSHFCGESAYGGALRIKSADIRLVAFSGSASA